MIFLLSGTLSLFDKNFLYICCQQAISTVNY
jgi:hypothetical protein